jgi:putative membrane protein
MATMTVATMAVWISTTRTAGDVRLRCDAGSDGFQRLANNPPRPALSGAARKEDKMKPFVIGAAALALFTAPAVAQMVTPSEFVGKAGASDTFEIDSARLMVTSHNAAIKNFATRMITDHTTSTKLVTAAAKADHLTLAKPEMTVGQRTDLTALKAVPAGKTKDDLYVKQQKAAHADALSLMQDYAAHGDATHLKATAAKIAPVVKKHQAMLSSL